MVITVRLGTSYILAWERETPGAGGGGGRSQSQRVPRFHELQLQEPRLVLLVKRWEQFSGDSGKGREEYSW